MTTERDLILDASFRNAPRRKPTKRPTKTEAKKVLAAYKAKHGTIEGGKRFRKEQPALYQALYS